MNIGTSVFTYLTQPGTGPIPSLPFPFNAFTYIDNYPNPNTLPMPGYRIRFYTDATRTVKNVDLPPQPWLGLSPSFVPQLYSTDPGACIITGDPADFEGFEAPQLRGLVNTAPYFHDNSMKTLEDVVEFYSSRVFVFVSAANLPPIFPSKSVGGIPETLSDTMQRQLVAFLKTL
jgi:cytochrome c peroxidase